MPGKRKKKKKTQVLSAGSGQTGLSEKEREARLDLFRKFQPEVKKDSLKENKFTPLAKRMIKNAEQSGDLTIKKKKKKKKKR